MRKMTLSTMVFVPLPVEATAAAALDVAGLGADTHNPGRGERGQVRRSLRIAMVANALLSAPLPASAQREAFVEGLVALTTALSGTYGDEGAHARAALDTMSRALTEWDRSLRENEETVAARLAVPSQNALEMHPARRGDDGCDGASGA
jgi:hypothetical protein